MTEETRWAFCNTKIIPKHLLIWMCFLRLLLAIWNVNCFGFFWYSLYYYHHPVFHMWASLYFMSCFHHFYRVSSLKKENSVIYRLIQACMSVFFSFLSVRKNLKNVASQKIMIVIFSKCVPILSWINFELGL